MYRSQLSRVVWLPLCLFISATTSFSQAPPSTAPAADATSNTKIIYTGKLLGYFRVPNKQSITEVKGCPQSSNGDPSKEARDFLQLRRGKKYLHAILVGTGDNFAPQLEARVFDLGTSQGKYPKGNKELFFGDKEGWVPYENVHGALREKFAHGLGTIPNDNVGCFLAAAKYDAIVPGKHDFYFGAERVRQFARFMASVKDEGDYQPVQMLGANLVLKTVPIKDPVVLPGQQPQPWFSKTWPDGYSVLNLSDQKSVYPWFSYVQIKLAELKPNHGLAKELKELLRNPMDEKALASFVLKARAETENSKYRDDHYAADLTALTKGMELAAKHALYICKSKEEADGDPNGNPNDIPHPENKECGEPLENAGVHFVDDALAYYYKLPHLKTDTSSEPKVKGGHFATVEPGKNYALCGIDTSTIPKGPKETKAGDGVKPYCMRFAVYTPFFYHPHPRPELRDEYTDPDPFVFIKDRKIAIFGVVEPNLGEGVGVLNFGWQNVHDKNLNPTNLKTLVSAENPVEALRQQVDYFERWYHETVDDKNRFTGLKVLLAQTSPQRARVLSARFPSFQVIVSAADEDQSTSEVEFSTTWSHEKRTGSFLATPLPAFESSNRLDRAHIGLIDAAPVGETWKLSSLLDKSVESDETASESDKKKEKVSLPNAEAAAFRSRVDTALAACAKTGSEIGDIAKLKMVEAVKWLTLCAIRERLGADVALIQKRDLYDQEPTAEENKLDKTQDILDRFIWKGDLLTLIYVPGSTLKAALVQSEKFVNDESAALLLVEEKGRQLEKLGIFSHPVTKENMINEAPIDDKKLYAVATTDYIATGDTGYPMLAKEALNPRTYPAGFPKELHTISSVACRKLFPEGTAEKHCLKPINRSKYLDESIAKQVTPSPGPSRFKKFWHSSPFKWPAESEPATTSAALLEQEIQRRSIWILSLRNASFGFSGVLSSRSDVELAEKFTGVSASSTSISTQETNTKTFLVDMVLSRTSHRREVFLGTLIDFKKTSTGDDIGARPNILQVNNRITFDAGYVHGLKGGRTPLRFGVIGTFHVETPFENPFSLFNLSTTDAEGNKEQLPVKYARSWLLLPRLGVRWLNGPSSRFELGVQGGRELNSLRGFRFRTSGPDAECLANPAQTFATCVTNESDPSKGGLVTKDSQGTAILETRPRAGFYAKGALSVPLHSLIKYEPSYEGDVFFNFSGDSPTDTKWRHIVKQNLKFTVFPNLSIGPTWQVLWYRSKNIDTYLIQHLVTMEISYGFDLFNRRERDVQLKRKQ